MEQNNIKIIDNLISAHDLREIHNTLVSSNFPWYCSEIISSSHYDESLNNLQLIHAFHYEHSIRSPYIDLIFPIIKAINPKAIVRIKANLLQKTETIVRHGYHRDFDFDCKTAVFYVNTNNGFTEFIDGARVESIENRLVVFDSSLEHTGTSTTNSPYRIVINFNYFD